MVVVVVVHVVVIMSLSLLLLFLPPPPSVARAHILAAQSPTASGRYLTIAETMTMLEMAKVAAGEVREE